MKKGFLAICSILLGISACVDSEKDLSRGNEVNLEQRIANCEAFENFTVPVKEGYTTYVILGEDTLAVANEPVTIKIPKSASSLTRAIGDNLKVDYDVLIKGDTYSKYFQAVMFEDTDNGDYDYNDLVIHARTQVDYDYRDPENSYQTVDVQGIAMGGTKTIALGCVLMDESEHYVSYDVRADLFDGTKGFINTVENSQEAWWKPMGKVGESNFIVKYKLEGRHKDAAWVAWFIEVDGKRFYAATTDISYENYNMVNKESMPYGIVAASTFTYPQEGISIFKAYPDFGGWIKGEKTSIGSASKPAQDFVFTIRRMINGQQKSVWDWQ